MHDNKNEIEDFKQFAANRLKIHQDELHTRYRDESIDKDTLEQGYEAHRKIFRQELKEKADTILAEKESPPLREEINSISLNTVKQLSTT